MDQDRFRNLLTIFGLALFAFALLVKIVFVRHEILAPGALARTGMVVDLAFAGALVGLVALTRRPLWWALAVDAVFSLVLFAAVLYVGYNDQLPTLQMLGMANQLRDVKASVYELLSPIQLILLADFVALGVMAALAGRWDAKSRRMQLFIALGVIGCAATVAWGSLQISSVSGPIDSIEAARLRGMAGWTVGSTFRTSEAAATKISAGDVKALQVQLDSAMGVTSKRIPDAPKTGVAKGKNVIVIQVEALQNQAIGLKVGGQEVTPNLNKLAKGSWYFDNVISQAGTGLTADAEYVTASSFYPPKGKPAPVVMADKAVPSLPRLLGEAGYQTGTMHVNAAAFWNRTQLYPALGYGRYWDRSYFGTEDFIHMGASDEVFFRKSMPLLEKMDASDKPYYVSLVTITSHHPFEPLPASKNPMPVPAEYQGTIAGNYMQDINYADRALGEFLAELEAKGMLDDTVLVVYGDHFGLKGKQEKQSDLDSIHRLLGKEYSHFTSSHIPVIVHLPNQKSGHTVNQLMGQTDIGPTVADLLGVSMASRPVFGASAFRVRKDPVVPTTCLTAYGSFVTDEGEWRVGLGTQGAMLKRMDGSFRPFESKDQALFDRSGKLVQLNDAYANSMPKRAFVGEVAKNAKLPPTAERALQELQTDEGN